MFEPIVAAGSLLKAGPAVTRKTWSRAGVSAEGFTGRRKAIFDLESCVGKVKQFDLLKGFVAIRK